MRERCRCACHARTIECSPCYRLHKLVEHLSDEFARDLALAKRQRGEFPAIADLLDARVRAFEDAQRSLSFWLDCLGDGWQMLDELVQPATAAAATA